MNFKESFEKTQSDLNIIDMYNDTYRLRIIEYRIFVHLDKYLKRNTQALMMSALN